MRTQTLRVSNPFSTRLESRASTSLRITASSSDVPCCFLSTISRVVRRQDEPNRSINCHRQGLGWPLLAATGKGQASLTQCNEVSAMSLQFHTAGFISIAAKPTPDGLLPHPPGSVTALLGTGAIRQNLDKT
jgi:hypothetical protein